MGHSKHSIPLNHRQCELRECLVPMKSALSESVKQAFYTFREGFPNVRISIEQMIEWDSVTFRFVLRNAHLEMFTRFPPTGKEDVLTGADFISDDSKALQIVYDLSEN
jgi:hypothetical protein